MKNIPQYILVVAVIIISACTKSPKTQYPIDAAVISHFDYHIGSYWIYNDSLSSRIDSFFVLGYSNNINQAYMPTTVKIDVIDANIIEYELGAVHQADTFVWDWVLAGDHVSLFMDYPKIRTGMGGGSYYGEIFPYPFKPQLMPNSYGNNGTTTAFVRLNNVLPTYTVNGASYSNVAQINFFYNLVDTPYSRTNSDTFYVCPDVGMIKIVLNHSFDSLRRVWELQRYHIAR